MRRDYDHEPMAASSMSAKKCAGEKEHEMLASWGVVEMKKRSHRKLTWLSPCPLAKSA
jgi:hypothetical protein